MWFFEVQSWVPIIAISSASSSAESKDCYLRMSATKTTPVASLWPVPVIVKERKRLKGCVAHVPTDRRADERASEPASNERTSC